MSGRPRHREARRPRSTDTLSTFDEVSPPYALSDVGRPRNDPDRARTQNAPRLATYGYQVDDIFISFADPWHSGPTRIEQTRVTISDTTGLDLSRTTKVVVALLKASIETGSRILSILVDHFTFGDGSHTEHFYRKLDTLWRLCVTVGAALCELGVSSDQEAAAHLLEDADGAHDFFCSLEGRLHNYEVVGLWTRRGDPATPAALAADIQRTFIREVDLLVHAMSYWDFKIHAKQFRSEDGLVT